MNLNDHKTKITGAILAFIGALQANSSVIQAAIPPKAFAWFTVLAGAVVTALGFLNSSQDNSEAPSSPPPNPPPSVK